jgi:hypothetical protein
MDQDSEPQANGIDMVVLLAEFTGLKERLESLEKEKEKWELERTQLEQGISKQQPLNESTTTSGNLPTPAEPLLTKAILNKPDKFSGDQKTYSVWRSGMAIKFWIDGQSMGLSNETAPAYMASFCEGDAGIYLQLYEKRIATTCMLCVFSYCAVTGNREWVAVIETVCASVIAISPLVIFEAVMHQASWYKNGILPHKWAIGVSENGWTTNEIGLWWLQNVFDKHNKDCTSGCYCYGLKPLGGLG